MKLTTAEKKVQEIIEPAIADLGFRLVTLKLEGDGNAQRLVVMAENAETGELGIDDCARISRGISPLLDVEDPIKGAYKLEVSSPGIDRPLVDIKDFTRFQDMLIKLETIMPIENQRKFKGKIGPVSEENKKIMIKADNMDQEIEFDNIKKAHLVITDELLELGARRREDRLKTQNN